MKLCYHCMHQIEKENIHTCPKCGKSLDIQPAGEKYLQPGTVLQGKFIVGYPLGDGGFGNTYIGWNRILFCKVAIKEFYPKQYCRRKPGRTEVVVEDENMRARFEKGRKQFLEEARSVAALQNIPGVVKISSFFEENETGYIVMEYLEGMDVKTILSKSGDKKDYEWCRRVTLTVLHTLREVHRQGVLHRDIAPDNIFVTDEGIIKLIDFGAAKQTTALTDIKPDIMLKTGYAPIEQYSREAPQGPYTDLYAAAALFYRMITGQRPIPANERQDHDVLISPSDMGIQIPEQAEMGIMVCLNVQPQYRLQSADELMEALDGRDFVPVYEPEWILPPEEKQGIGERISRLPMAAKAGICLGVIFLIGLTVFGTVMLGDQGSKKTDLENEAIVMNDLSGMTEDEAAANIEELKERALAEGITLELDFKTDGYIFELDQERSGTIASQTIKPSSVIYDPDAESQKEVAGLTRDKDGNISGTVSCSLYDNTKLHYSDISGLNVYAMAKKLGIDTSDSEHFQGTKEVEDSSYYDLIKLQTPDGEIAAKELGKKKNQKKEITYQKGKISIIYSNIPFFYWEALPDFKQAYGTLDQIPQLDTYVWKNETQREPSGQKKALKEVSGMVNDAYCTIRSSESSKGSRRGDIVNQAFPAGEELDTSRTKAEDGLLHVIGDEIFYSGKNGNQLKEELVSRWGESVNVVPGGSGAMTQPVLSVKITDETGNSIDYFRRGQAVTVTLNLKAVPALAPQPPVYQEEGNYSEGSYSGAGSTGGGYSGGSSGGYDPGGSSGGSSSGEAGGDGGYMEDPGGIITFAE